MKRLRLLMVVCALFVGTGCSFILPSTRSNSKSPWESFEQAKQDFDLIVVNQTTVEDLKSSKYNPAKLENVEYLSYVDLLQKFLPNSSIQREDLDPGLQQALSAKDRCYGYEYEPKILREKRYGFFLLDWLNFTRNTRTTGWRFNALVVVKDEVVVYKLWSGTPKIDLDKKKTNPLGPLQEAGNIVSKGVDAVVPF
jgi:hypothetical protein